MQTSQPKELIWIASSLRDLKGFPEPVKQTMGFAIFQAQCGGKHVQAKPIKVKGGGVLEVIDDYDGDTYRVMYTVRFGQTVYALHAFQKKSKKGTKTPKHEIEVVERRLKIAAQLHAERSKREEGK